jgi:polygalacturonase
LVFLVLTVILCNPVYSSDREPETFINALFRDTPFEMEPFHPPFFPDRSFDIRDYGAKGDGLTMNTRAINGAIAACADSGGGTIIIPSGVWLSGPLFMKSNVELHLLQGALLRFSKTIKDYPVIKSSYEGTEQYRSASPINAVGLENIAITGRGVIDGSGEAWRPVKRFKMTNRQWNELLDSGGVLNNSGTIWWPSATARDGKDYLLSLENKETVSVQDVLPVRHYLRPVMVRLVNCKNILLDGPTFQNSPAWNIHPLTCENMTIRNITVRNPWYSQNGDGLDLESCKNVVVYSSEFDVGDDAICLKSGKNEAGRRRGIPCENIIIRNCTVYHGHGGVTVGSEMSGGVRNVHVVDCLFMGTDVGLRFKSARGRGGVVENLCYDNIRMTGIENQAILFDMFYEGGFARTEDVPQPSEETPVFRKITFNNITSLDAGTSVYLRGLPEMPLNGLVFNKLNLTSLKGISCYFSDNIEFNNTNLKVEESPVVTVYQSKDILLDIVTLSYPGATFIKVDGDKCENIYLTGPEVEHMQYKFIEYGDQAGSTAVQLQSDLK